MILDTEKVVTLLREWDDNTWREIGKTDKVIVIVSTHLYDGVRSLPLDVELYQHADSLPQGKEDQDLVKKPDIARKLVNQTLKRKYRRPNCFNRGRFWE